jgi:predicted secreted acid phosphatase
VKFKDRAVFLDIDDTLLVTKLNFTRKIECMHDFYKFLVQQKAKIYIITARPYSPTNLKQTINQLRHFGYNDFDALFLMKLNKGVLNTSKNIAFFKSTIRQKIRESMEIDTVLSVGNEWHDLVLPQFININFNSSTTYLFNAVGENLAFLLKLPLKSV